MVTLEIEGLPQLQQAFVRFAQQAHAALVQALQVEAERILEESRELCPVDTGLLASTGMSERQQDGADIRFGGHGLAPYSIIVHERTDTHHPVGQHHYLSAPFLAATADMPARLGAQVASQIRT